MYLVSFALNTLPFGQVPYIDAIVPWNIEYWVWLEIYEEMNHCEHHMYFC